MILPTVRNPRLTTIRRGGTLTDADHHLLVLWAAAGPARAAPRRGSPARGPEARTGIEHARAWVRGEVPTMAARAAGGSAMGAARDLRDAAYAAGQAAVVAHVAAHDLGAAAYAIKAARAAAPAGEGETGGRAECRWQREWLPDAVRELVLDDQRVRKSSAGRSSTADGGRW